MSTVKKLLLASLITFWIASPATASSKTDLGDLSSLQAALQQFVDRKTVDGAYLLFDLDTTQVRELYPSSPHPMVLKMDEHFVMCFDFVDAKGAKVEVDYYVARKDDGFVVFHEAVGSRELLKNLMNKGLVSRVN